MVESVPVDAAYAEGMSAITTSEAEYRAATEACGVLDRSERGKLALTGSEAKSFLQGQVTNDIESLTPGTGCYAAFLTPKGKMLGDLRVLDAGAGGLLLDTERAALQALFNMIRRFSIGYDVVLHKRTLESGLVSLLGPLAAEIAGATALGAGEHTHAEVQLHDLTVRAIRTDRGVDLMCAAEETPALIEALAARGGQPVGEEVAECLRIESGRPRYGIELDDTVIPQEAGLNDRAVSFTKGCYVGQETVARLFYRGKPNRHLRGLRCVEPVAPGGEVRFEDRTVATVASATVSPRLGPIALALVRREAPPGSAVRVGPDEVAATVTELPFA
jgi:folate-binding protein YgfZ